MTSFHDVLPPLRFKKAAPDHVISSVQLLWACRRACRTPPQFADISSSPCDDAFFTRPVDFLLCENLFPRDAGFLSVRAFIVSFFPAIFPPPPQMELKLV